MKLQNSNVWLIVLAVAIEMVAWNVLASSTCRSFNERWEWKWDCDSGWKTTDVPHDAAWDRGYDSSASGYHGYVPMDGILRYRKMFPCPVTNGVSHVIRFDGVYMDSSVFLNGRRVGGRQSGHIGFDVPLDGFKATNVIEVVCDERTPNARWYPGAGILRNVWWIERRGFSLCEKDIAVRPELLPDGRARVRVISDIGEVIEPKGGEFIVEHPALWSPEAPNLRTVRVTVRREDGEDDSLDVRYGIRSVEFTKDRGILLNGKPYRLRGLCQHENFGCLGAALNRSALRRQLLGMKAIGANAIRTVHNPFSPEFYALCDELGFLVMNEAFDEWEKPKVKNGYCRFFAEWAERDLASFVRRDRNHPCVLMWSIGNEIPEMREPGEAGSRWAKRLADVARRHDPTRPVTAGSDRPVVSAENGTYAALDVVGLNYNAEAFDTLKGRYAMYASETTASLCSRDSYFFAPTGNVLKVVDAQDFQEHSYAPRIVFAGASTLEDSLKVQMEKTWSAGEFSWSYSDYLGEPYRTGASAEKGWPSRSSYWGICDLAGFPKDRYYLHRALWTVKPTLHLMPDWTLPGCEHKRVPVRCYTNCREAELFLNGRSMGVRKRDETTDLHLSWEVPYEIGTLEVRAKTDAGGQLVDRRTTVGMPVALKVTEDYSDDDYVFYRVDAVDAAGRRAIACNAFVTVEAEGGAVVATDNGDATDHTPFGATTRRLFRGSLLAVVLRKVSTVKLRPSFAESPRSGPTLFFAGDSTLDDHGVSLGGQASDPYRSWGTELVKWMVPGCTVENYAQSGRSTKSFLREGHWKRLISRVKSGDYVAIQFGHNDQKRSSEKYEKFVWADPNGLFREIVRKWVVEVREKGATPILLSPICRATFDETGTRLLDVEHRTPGVCLGSYREAMRELSEELKCDYVDMNTLTHDLLERVGRDAAYQFYVISAGLRKAKDGEPLRDTTHPVQAGADAFARLFVTDVRVRRLEIARLFISTDEIEGR